MASLSYTFQEPFNLRKTFECGQIFRYVPANNFKTVYAPIRNRVVKIIQKSPKKLEIQSNRLEGLETLMDSFLRVDDNYKEMLEEIAIDTLMKKISFHCRGLRLLKQDLFECMFSFILSQCSNIPRIKKNLSTLVQDYGRKVNYENRRFYLFPTPEMLKGCDEEIFREMGFGYRAKYLSRIIDSCPDFLENKKSGEKFCLDCSLDTEELNKKLKSIYGVGQKVSDCVQLFAAGDLRLFPVDTWMKKFMKKYYCTQKKVSERKIRHKGQELFGKWAGYAQEFIFYYARTEEVFEKPKKPQKG